MASRLPKPSSAGSSRSKSVTASDGVTGGGGANNATAAEMAATQFDPAPPYPTGDIPSVVRDNISSEEARLYLEEHVSPTLAQGLKALCMLRPANPVDYLALFLLRANPHVPPEQRGVVEVSTNLDDIAPIPQAED